MSVRLSSGEATEGLFRITFSYLTKYSVKLDGKISTTSKKNRLTFGCDSVPDTDSGSLFHFFNIAEE